MREWQRHGLIIAPSSHATVLRRVTLRFEMQDSEAATAGVRQHRLDSYSCEMNATKKITVTENINK